MESLNIFIRSIFIDNMVFAFFFGMCSYIAVSKNVKTALGLGLAVTFVMVMTVPLNYLLYEYVLKADVLVPGVDLSFLTFIVFIATIAAFVQLVEMAVEKFSPTLYNQLGIFLPLIAVNCAILGGSLFMQQKVDALEITSLWQSIVYGLGSGLGWWLAIVMMAAIREKTTYSQIPAALRGPGIAFIITGLMGIAFMIFSGIKLESFKRDKKMTLTIIIAIVAFLVITLVLVGLLLFAKAKLTTSGDVTIDINGGEKVLIAESGGTLLSTLANNNVFLPSACGGGGSCGMCKCQVLEGGGELLPTETGFINRKMAKEHWRLGCQVKVKENLKIHVPESVLGVKKWECEVISNRNISTFLKEFVVKLPEGENLKFRSGGYIQIDIPKYDAIKFSDMDIEEPYREDWDKMKMWDLVTKNPEPTFRAYSMANHPAEGNIIMLNIRIATPPFDRATGTFAKVNPGICSSYIFSRKPGDKVTISGPYGEFFLPDNLPATQELVFIGGGAGMAPMRSHIMHLFKTEKTSRPVSFWYGARALKEVPYMDEFLEIQREFPNFKFHLALDRPDPQADAAGVKYTPGFVHNVLYENYLKNHQAPEDNIYLMCGPPMMISSVVKMLDSLGVPSENILYDNFGS
ncbi:NADH:ubiquinone reductase (Na(+)-transporting) subunit F [Alistipes putredinis]